jgi:hypothetical protein
MILLFVCNGISLLLSSFNCCELLENGANTDLIDNGKFRRVFAKIIRSLSKIPTSHLTIIDEKPVISFNCIRSYYYSDSCAVLPHHEL